MTTLFWRGRVLAGDDRRSGIAEVSALRKTNRGSLLLEVIPAGREHFCDNRRPFGLADRFDCDQRRAKTAESQRQSRASGEEWRIAGRARKTKRRRAALMFR
jgi:hypothetical protein